MYQAVVERLRPKVVEEGDVEFDQFEELEVYKIVFETSDFDIEEHPVQVIDSEAKETILTSDQCSVNGGSAVIPISGIFRENFEEFSSQRVEKEVKPLMSSNFNKGASGQEPYMRSGSKAMGNKVNADDGRVCLSSSRGSDSNPGGNGEYTPKVVDNFPTTGSSAGAEYFRRINSRDLDSNPDSNGECTPKVVDNSPTGSSISKEYLPRMSSRGSDSNLENNGEYYNYTPKATDNSPRAGSSIGGEYFLKLNFGGSDSNPDSGRENSTPKATSIGRDYFSRMNSRGSDSNLDSGEEYCTPKAMDNSSKTGSNLGSFGSMRKEKEWRRTLACKLFEERHNSNGSEGMDMLWETYEKTDSIKAQRKSKSKRGQKAEYYDDEDEEDDEDGDEPRDGKLCCLQALKFSAGKMNLGMGKPNLVKISKALKGIGWLHHVSKGKKGHH